MVESEIVTRLAEAGAQASEAMQISAELRNQIQRVETRVGELQTQIQNGINESSKQLNERLDKLSKGHTIPNWAYQILGGLGIGVGATGITVSFSGDEPAARPVPINTYAPPPNVCYVPNPQDPYQMIRVPCETIQPPQDPQ